ncbi:glycosyltransferase [Candidatus Binatus sp.]|uniref:glycosyltransferase n=1 Tax=Candidatus Binatus sp. TaxID=2811406 RepID=UPI002FD9B728
MITWHSDVARQQRLARLYQPLERILLERCSAIVATSPAYIAGSPVLRMHANRWHLIPYGIDAGQFDDDRVDQSMAEKLRQRFGPRMILSVGRLVYYKGIKFLIQAMACGRPVVNTQIDSGVPYASLDGVSGFTVQPKSSDAMATALNRLLDNPELRMRIGRAARERAVAEFGIREMAARTLELYRSVLFTDNRNRIRGDAAPLQSDHCAANKDGHAAFRHTEAGT